MRKKNKYSLLKKMVSTEKSQNALEHGKYTFFVDKTATKCEIKEVIKKIFGVDVASINVVNLSSRKKAIIQLANNQTIQM